MPSIDPMTRNLVDLVEQDPNESFILGGGLSLQLKRLYLLHYRLSTLASVAGYELPEARATTDIDIFLKLEVFVQPDRGQALRKVIDALGYKVKTEKWQFEKPLQEGTTIPLTLDLLARIPETDENVKVKGIRVGSGSLANLNGRKAIEAFAVEDMPIKIDILDNGSLVTRVSVIHPFGMLNLKLRAAHDWLTFQSSPWELKGNQKPPSAKHAFDACLLVAMLTEEERDQATELAEKWLHFPLAEEIRKEAVTLFGTQASLGWLQAVRDGIFDDHELIWETMQQALGIA
jgi:hypothetical protein